MSWADKYNEIKRKKDTEYYLDEKQKIELFEEYKQKVYELYDKLKHLIKGTPISYRTQKITVPVSSYRSFTGVQKDIDILILSDNDNEVKFVPEGINFIGVFGKLSLKNYTKIVTFQSITEKRLKILTDPCLYLIKDKDMPDKKVWAYKIVNDDKSKEIKKLNETMYEKILDDIFIG